MIGETFSDRVTRRDETASEADDDDISREEIAVAKRLGDHGAKYTKPTRKSFRNGQTIKKIAFALWDRWHDDYKRMDSERERARREAKKVRRYERLESLGLRRLGSSAIKRKG